MQSLNEKFSWKLDTLFDSRSWFSVSAYDAIKTHQTSNWFKLLNTYLNKTAQYTLLQEAFGFHIS